MRTALHADALAIWHAGLAAVDPVRLIHACVRWDGPLLALGAHRWDPRPGGRVALLGGGKAGASMTLAVEQALGADFVASGRCTGVVNVIDELALPRRGVRLQPARPAGDPFPTQRGADGCHQMLALAATLGPTDLAIGLISGGASALMPCPVPSISIADKRALTTCLSRAGADIQALNTVRKHLSLIKGGRLAVAGKPGSFISLILSDVIGNPLDIIASGPTVADPSTYSEALAVLQGSTCRERVPPSVVRVLEEGLAGLREETPKRLPSTVHNLILGDNNTALTAAAAAARDRGFRVVSLGSAIAGESRDVGRDLALRALAIRDRQAPDPPPVCLISGGETVVRNVRPGGKGGRNQELMLGFLETLRRHANRQGIAAISGGTDGEDGPTDAAGAFVNESILSTVLARALDPAPFFTSSRSYDFFEQAGGLFKTGPTHTNVMDLRVVLVSH